MLIAVEALLLSPQSWDTKQMVGLTFETGMSRLACGETEYLLIARVTGSCASQGRASKESCMPRGPRDWDKTLLSDWLEAKLQKLRIGVVLELVRLCAGGRNAQGNAEAPCYSPDKGDSPSTPTRTTLAHLSRYATDGILGATWQHETYNARGAS